MAQQLARPQPPRRDLCCQEPSSCFSWPIRSRMSFAVIFCVLGLIHSVIVRCISLSGTWKQKCVLEGSYELQHRLNCGRLAAHMRFSKQARAAGVDEVQHE